MIFDGLEASSQLDEFFLMIERPTLTNVKLKYIGNVDQGSITKHSKGQTIRQFTEDVVTLRF